jgi:hypothetical protein
MEFLGSLPEGFLLKIRDGEKGIDHCLSPILPFLLLVLASDLLKKSILIDEKRRGENESR